MARSRIALIGLLSPICIGLFASFPLRVYAGIALTADAEAVVTLVSRARAFGRRSGSRSHVATLVQLVPTAPASLHAVEVEVDDFGAAFPVAVDPLLGRSAPGEFWRELEREVARFLSPGDLPEVRLVASIVRKLGWHPRKHAVLRMLETRAYLSDGDRRSGQAPRGREHRAPT